MNVADGITPVILAGKSGLRPKSFLRLLSKKSLFQHTVLNLTAFRAPVIVCHQDYKDTIRYQLAEIGVEIYTLILEPFHKGTTAAIALGALHIREEDAPMVVVPAHYSILQPDLFSRSILAATICAQRKIVMLGAKLSRPQTRYGYILAQPEAEARFHPVWAFIEQPNRAGAANLHQSKGCFWNTGIMVCKPKVFLGALKRLQPDIYRSCERAFFGGKHDDNLIYPDAQNFVNADALPVGFSVIEKLKDAYVMEIPANLLQNRIIQRLGKVKDSLRVSKTTRKMLVG